VAVKIRLMRVGKKKQPTYRVVVADARAPRDGRLIETIGQYAPRREPSLVEIDAESALAWLRKGAQPTEQAQKLLAVSGVWERFEAERGRPATTKLSRRRLGAKPAGAAEKGAPSKGRAKSGPKGEAAAAKTAAAEPGEDPDALAPTEESGGE
jgi:small subunit ribosomal protein S16